MKTKQLLLSLLALLVSITANAEHLWDFQAGGFYYIITSSNSVCVTYEYYDEDEGTYFGGYNGTKTIPSSVTYNTTTYNVTAIGDHAFENCPSLTSVIIPNSVTSIGVDAFSECSRLTSISIPNSVASIAQGALTYTAWYDNQPDGLLYAGKVAYAYKGEMPQGTNIVLNDGTLGIADCAFAGQSNLTSITIPSSVTNIGAEAFFNCSDLNPIIPNSVISVGYRALDNTAWRSNQPDGVLYAGKVAYGYKGVMSEGTNIVLEEGTTAITDYAFYYQSHLTSITIPSSVTNIGPWAFYYCSGLTSVTCNRETPPSATASFPGASSVTLYVPLGSKTAYMASVWSNFKEIIEDAGPSITFTDDAVKALCVSNWDTTGDGELGEKEAAAVTSIGNVFKYNSTITSFDELQYFTGLTSIGVSAFSGCSNLTSVTIPNGVTLIDSYAFEGCSSLTSVTIPYSVTSIGSSPFYGCI